MSSVTNSPQISMPILHDALALMSNQGEKIQGELYETQKQKFQQECHQNALSLALTGIYQNYPKYSKDDGLASYAWTSHVLPSVLTHDVMWIMCDVLSEEQGAFIKQPFVIFRINKNIAINISVGSNCVRYTYNNPAIGSTADEQLVSPDGVINSRVLSDILSVQNNPVRTKYLGFLRERISTELPFIPPGVNEIVSQFIFC